MYDELYLKIKNYIVNTDNKELKEHYKWYKVKIGDKIDLINIMYESYCNNYDEEELKIIIKEW